MQDVVNRGGPNSVLNCQSMRSISGPKANHRVRLSEGPMQVPLITAVVGKEIVDHTIETRPVGAVVSIRSLRTGDCDMRIRISFDRRVASGLVSARESDLHERPVIGPRSKVLRLRCFFRRVRRHRIPIIEIRAPYVVERRERAVLLLQPAAKIRERMWIPVEVDSVAV